MNLVIIETEKKSRNKTERLKSSLSKMKINNEYLIERIIRIGSKNGMKRVFCIINSHDPELEHYLSSNDFGIPTKLIVPNPESSMHVLVALASIHSEEPFFIITANSVFINREFSEFVTYSLLQQDIDGAISVTGNLNDEKPLGVAMNDEDVIFKLNNSKEGYSWFNGGIYYFSPHILNETNYAFLSHITSVEKFLHFLIESGYILKGFSFSKIIRIYSSADIILAEDWIGKNE